MLYERMEDMIGNTPLLRASRYCESKGVQPFFVKLERFEPAGSVKDRAALYMIEGAVKAGRLKKGGVIVEPTSGNTGIGLAAIGAARGFSVVLVMPDSMSVERINYMKAFGAEVVLTPAAAGMQGALDEAERIAKERGAFTARQFDNADNARAHYETTGVEIEKDLNPRKADVFVAGVGTGGTLTGAGGYLKSVFPQMKIIAAEPMSSPLLSGGKAAGHKIQGIGANFIPSLLDRALIDEVTAVPDDAAMAEAALFGKREGLLVGISSGAALFAAVKAAREYPGKNVVTVLPDGGEKYMSTSYFEKA